MRLDHYVASTKYRRLNMLGVRQGRSLPQHIIVCAKVCVWTRSASRCCPPEPSKTIISFFLVLFVFNLIRNTNRVMHILSIDIVFFCCCSQIVCIFEISDLPLYSWLNRSEDDGLVCGAIDLIEVWCVCVCVCLKNMITIDWVMFVFNLINHPALLGCSLNYVKCMYISI